MKKNIKLLPIICFFALCACKSGNASSQSTTVAQDTIKVFTLPTIPQMLTGPDQRADFLVKHYWDNVNFADTNYVHHPEITEQAWADYCDILNHVPLKTAHEAIRQTVDKASTSKVMFTHITELADKYLYDPNSPLRNEEFYIPVLEAMVASPMLDKTEKIRPEARLKLANKNRIGTKALNFTYTLASGAQGTLYNIHTDYTLLFINNPGCHACTEAIEQLKNATTINKLLDAKKLTILSVYPDEEIDNWRKHLTDFPPTWINGYDKKLTITEKELYDLKATPTIYLLNKDKIVLLKDVNAPAAEEYLAIH